MPLESFYRKVFAIALPIAIQQIIFSAVNFVDTLMIGQLGEVAIASVGLSNQFYFLFHLLLFGLSSGGAIFIAQFWGKKELDNIAKTACLMSIFGILASVFFFIMGVFFPSVTLRIFTPDPLVIEQGAQYLKIVAISFPITAISLIFATTMRSTEHAFVAMLISVVTMLSNVFFNWIFIFGNFGAPELGTMGAGIGTLISRSMEFVIYMVLLRCKKFPGSFGIVHIKSIQRRFVGRFLSYTMPTIGNEFVWSLGVTTYAIIYGHISTQVVAVNRIIEAIQSLSFSVLFALATATAVVLGKSIGISQFETAQREGLRLLRLSLVISIGLALLILLAGNPLLSLFNVIPEVHQLAWTILIMAMIFFPIRNLNCILVVGILRSGADTRFTFAVESLTLWGIGVPLVGITGLVLRWPFPFVFGVTIIEEMVKLLIITARFRSRKWAKNVVNTV